MWYTSRAGLILMDVFIPIGASASIQDVRYRHVEGWAELPDGVEAWGQTIGIETDDNDNLWVFHRCFANNCREREDVPPMLRYDPSGRLVDSWGEGMFVWPGIMASGIHITEDDTVLVPSPTTSSERASSSPRPATFRRSPSSTRHCLRAWPWTGWATSSLQRSRDAT